MNHRKIPIRPGSGECPVCHGTGWEIYKATVFDYGDPEEMDFARPCTNCTGARRLKDKTGVPDDYYSADLTKFDFRAYSTDISKIQQVCQSMMKDFDEWNRLGKGLYIWSKTPGSGKTYLACCLAKSLMMAHDLQMRFITAPDYISLVGDSYKRDRGEEDKSQIYRTCKLLVLDDIGSQIDKEWQRQELFRLTNYRVEHGGLTIYTSNLATSSLNVDDRTKDRIIKSSIIIQMPEESIRRKRATEEQDKFLQSILREGA